MCFLFVFTLDYLIPFKVAGGIGTLYIAAILINTTESKKTILFTTLLATILISIKFIYFFNISNPVQHLGFPFNRILSIIGLWVATVVALKVKQADEELLLQRAKYTEAIEEIIYINSHKVRKPVTNIVKLVELMEDDNLSDKHAKQMMAYLRKSAKELESATREMTDTISEKDYNQELLISSSI